MPVFLKIFNLILERERGREGEREGEKHQCVVASHAPPTGDLACNPARCPDRESNPCHFTLWDDPSWSGRHACITQGTLVNYLWSQASIPTCREFWRPAHRHNTVNPAWTLHVLSHFQIISSQWQTQNKCNIAVTQSFSKSFPALRKRTCFFKTHGTQLLFRQQCRKDWSERSPSTSECELDRGEDCKPCEPSPWKCIFPSLGGWFLRPHRGVNHLPLAKNKCSHFHADI